MRAPMRSANSPREGVGYPSLQSNFVAFGDSNTAGSGDVGGPADAYAGQMAVRSRGRFKMLFNSGVPGERSDQIIARMDADLATYSPDIAFIMMGTNNIEQSYAQSAFQADCISAASKCRAAGLVPVFLALFPNDNHPTETLAYNAWLAAWCASNRHWFVDVHTPLGNGSGGWNVTYKQDALHAKVAGDVLVSDTILAALSANVWTAWPVPTSDVVSNDNLLVNSLSMLDSDVNGVPDGWFTFGSNIVAEMVNDVDRGRGVKLTLTGATAAGLQANTVATNFTVGDVILPLFDARISSGLSTSMGVRFIGPNTNGLLLTPWAAAFDGIGHGKLTIPGATTSLSYRIYATGTGTIELFARNSLLRNLTRSPFADY